MRNVPFTNRPHNLNNGGHKSYIFESSKTFVECGNMARKKEKDVIIHPSLMQRKDEQKTSNDDISSIGLRPMKTSDNFNFGTITVIDNQTNGNVNLACSCRLFTKVIAYSYLA